MVLHSSTILATARRVGAPVIATAFPLSGEGLVPQQRGCGQAAVSRTTCGSKSSAVRISRRTSMNRNIGV